MRKGILGRKLGMTQLFNEKGDVVAVTVVEAGPCVVVQKKTKEKDGYESVQIGFDNLKATRVNKPMNDHYKKANAAPKRFLKELDTVSINQAKNQNLSLNPTKINGVCGRLLCCLKYEDETYTKCRKCIPKIGDKIKTDIFSVGEKVDVSAKGKGKGFAGTIKRHGAHLLKKSHGTGPVRRQPGSMSGASDPSRIFKGKKMPGRMGGKKVTVQSLELIKIDAEKNLIVVKGAIPGPRGAYVSIINSVKTAGKEEK